MIREIIGEPVTLSMMIANRSIILAAGAVMTARRRVTTAARPSLEITARVMIIAAQQPAFGAGP